MTPTECDAGQEMPDGTLRYGEFAIGLALLAWKAEAMRKRSLLTECNEAMNETTRRYRTMAGLPGDSTEVSGSIAWLDQMQAKIHAERDREQAA